MFALRHSSRSYLKNAGFVVVGGQQAENGGTEVTKRMSSIDLKQLCSDRPQGHSPAQKLGGQHCALAQ